jgi:hypothetical protein
MSIDIEVSAPMEAWKTVKRVDWVCIVYTSTGPTRVATIIIVLTVQAGYISQMK